VQLIELENWQRQRGRLAEPSPAIELVEPYLGNTGCFQPLDHTAMFAQPNSAAACSDLYF
jgi:hypothetical protein